MGENSGLGTRLRSDTAVLHRQTEELVGVPARIRTVDDYAALLRGMLAFHRETERALRDPRWEREWLALGIAMKQHDRSDQIVDDLRVLGLEIDDRVTVRLTLASFAEALGCLYVVEGSSLGGRFIGPALTGRLGIVPMTFYNGDGRAHPAPWRSLQRGLRAYEQDHDNVDEVIFGAKQTFTFFGQVVQPAAKSHEPV